MRYKLTDATDNIKYNLNSLWTSPNSVFRDSSFVKSPSTYYFSKRDPDQKICEMITRLNILPNQFSVPKHGGGRGIQPPSLPPWFRRL